MTEHEWDADFEHDDSIVSLLDDSVSVAHSSSIGLGGCATQSSIETQKSDDKRSACSSGMRTFLYIDLLFFCTLSLKHKPSIQTYSSTLTRILA